MDAGTAMSYSTANIPVLVSTAITIGYFIIKLINYIINASSREAQARKRMPSTGIPKQEHCSAQRAESGVEVYKEVSKYLYETTTDG